MQAEVRYPAMCLTMMQNILEVLSWSDCASDMLQSVHCVQRVVDTVQEPGTSSAAIQEAAGTIAEQPQQNAPEPEAPSGVAPPSLVPQQHQEELQERHQLQQPPEPEPQPPRFQVSHSLPISSSEALSSSLDPDTTRKTVCQAWHQRQQEQHFHGSAQTPTLHSCSLKRIELLWHSSNGR